MKYCLFDRDPYNGYIITIPTQLDRISSPYILIYPEQPRSFSFLMFVYAGYTPEKVRNGLEIVNFCGSHNWRGIFVFFFKSLLIFFLAEEYSFGVVFETSFPFCLHLEKMTHLTHIFLKSVLKSSCGK